MQTDVFWLRNKKRIRYILTTGILLIPVVLYFIPIEWLESQHTICLYKNLTGHDCYGCGMTRAIISAIHFQFTNAYHFNKLFVIVLPLLVYIWGKMLVDNWHGAQGTGRRAQGTGHRAQGAGLRAQS